MNYHQKYLSSCFLGIVALLSVGSFDALAQTAPSLGSASNFAVLGATTVTCTGVSTITGNVGVSPGSAVTGFPVPCTDAGTIHAADAVAVQAQTDAASAYAALTAQQCTTNLSGQDLGGMTLASGVYCFNSSAQLTGTLNLVGTGPFIFQIGSTLTTASNAVVLINGLPIAPGVCVPGAFFAVGSSATLGTGTQFQGTIIAQTSDTLTTGANVSGGVFALNGAVTLDTNRVDVCGGTTPTSRPGRMTGGGSVFTSDGTRVTHGFELHCNSANMPNNLEVNWAGNRFHLDTLTAVFCSNDPSFRPNPPDAGFNTLQGSGTGTYNGVPGATAQFTFTDAGEPGTKDSAQIVIKEGTTTVLTVAGHLDHGNQQAHAH